MDCHFKFKDEIDEWLFNEMGLIPGCCSSIESLKYDIARESIEKFQESLIQKSCKWIGNHLLSSWQGEYLEKFKRDVRYGNSNSKL